MLDDVSEDEVNLHMDRLLVEARDLIGKLLPGSEAWNEQVTKDSIRHFVYGIGDNNPLYLNEEYASKVYGCLIAPPTFLYSVENPSYLGPPTPPCIACIQAGDEWEWYEIIKVGDIVRWEKRITDVNETFGKYLGRMIFITSECTYYNQTGAKIAKAKSKVIHYPAKFTKNLFNRSVSKYTEKQIRDLLNQTRLISRRGHAVRYWEEVDVGEDIPSVVKGPLTLGDLVAWFAGKGVPYKACELFALEVNSYPSLERPLPLIDIPSIGYKSHPEVIHVDANLAALYGIPAAFDEGPMRICWAAQMLTNWMGFLKKLSVEITDMNIYGDITVWRGKVVQKSMDREPVVECEIWATNQLGNITAEGSATVILPRRLPDSLPKVDFDQCSIKDV